MSLVQTPFAVKIHFRVATGAGFGRRGVLGAKILCEGPGLDEGAIHGEMLVRQQSGCGRLRFDAPEKGRRQVRTEKALLILGKDGMFPDFVAPGETDKPVKQEIVVQLLHQQADAADGVKDLQQ